VGANNVNENELFIQALAAAQAGQRAQAKRVLAELVNINPRHEQAWLRLAGLVDNSVQTVDCLKRVIAINPNNFTARDWLHKIQSGSTTPLSEAVVGGPLDEDVPLAEPGDSERPVPRLGQYLLDYQFITAEQLRAALMVQRTSIAAGNPRRLGDILLEQGALEPERLEFAVREQHRSFYSLFND
jgi:hypothetical protein